MYFAIKCQARGIIADKREFDMVIREMAYKNYDREIQRQTRSAFIPFDEAWRAVETVVEGLPNTNL